MKIEQGYYNKCDILFIAYNLRHTEYLPRRAWTIARARVPVCMPKWNPRHVCDDNKKKVDVKTLKCMRFIQILDFTFLILSTNLLVEEIKIFA